MIKKLIVCSMLMSGSAMCWDPSVPGAVERAMQYNQETWRRWYGDIEHRAELERLEQQKYRLQQQVEHLQRQQALLQQVEQLQQQVRQLQLQQNK